MDERQRAASRSALKANTHELYCLSLNELDEVVVQRSQEKSGVRQTWQEFTGIVEGVAGYTATGKDLATLTKVFADLGFAGTRAYVKYYRGKPFVIFKGHPGLRNIFTGTRYSMLNAKIVQMGIGRAGAVHAVKSGGVLTIVLLSAFRIVDYLLTDEMTLNQLIGTLATDVVKVGIATGASIAAATAAAAVFTVAIGPIVAAIGVGVLAAYGVSKLDEHFEVTEKVIAMLDEMGKGIRQVIEDKKRESMRLADRMAESAIDYALESAQRVAIDTARHILRRLLAPGVPTL